MSAVIISAHLGSGTRVTGAKRPQMSRDEILALIRKEEASREEKNRVYQALMEYMSPEADFSSDAPFSYLEKGEIGYWVGLEEMKGTFGEIEHFSEGSNEGYWAGINE